MSIPKNRSYLGIAKETRPVPGAAPASVAATNFIPWTSYAPVDNVTYLDDKGIRGSMVEDYGQIQGNIFSEHDLGGNLHPDTFGYILAGVLGDVATTGAASIAYTHVMSVLNSQSSNGQPVTYSLTDYYGLGASSSRVFAGCQFSEVDVKFAADGLMTYAAKAKGYASAVVANPTPSFGTVPPVPSWQGITTLAASVNAQMSEGNIKISRPVTPILTVTGNQRPYQLFAGPVSCEGQLTLVFEADTQLQYYLSNTQPALQIDFSAGSGATATQVMFSMTKCAFIGQAKIERSKDWLELTVPYKGVANTTDAGASGGFSPVKATLKNAKASGTYV